MSLFTEPLSYASTDRFVGGWLFERRLRIDGRDEKADTLVFSRRIYRVQSPFVYDDHRTGAVITVERGFETDLGSIPALARWWLSPSDPWAQAFVLHDRLYQTQQFARKDADRILLDALKLPFRAYSRGRMLRVLCPFLERWAIYYAVRLGGAYPKRPDLHRHRTTQVPPHRKSALDAGENCAAKRG